MATLREIMDASAAQQRAADPNKFAFLDKYNAIQGGPTQQWYTSGNGSQQASNQAEIDAYNNSDVGRQKQALYQEGVARGYIPKPNNGGLSGFISNKLIPGVIQGATLAGIGGGLAGIAGIGPAAAGGSGYVMPGANAAASGATGGLLADGAASTYEGASLVGGASGAGIGAGSGAAATAVPSAGGAGAAGAGGGLGSWLVPAAIAGSSGLGALASLHAAKVQSDAADKASQATKDMFDQTRADLGPWREAGKSALDQLMHGNFKTDPGYEFRQSEGEKAINRAAAARGGWDSGAALKSLTRYNQDYASGEYGNWWNRLAGLAGIGQTATNQTGVLGAGATNQSNDALTSGASARGAGSVGAANAITGGVASGINLINQNRLMDLLFQKSLTT